MVLYMTNLEDKLFHIALDIINDVCPMQPKDYLCKKQLEYDESICNRCMSNYLFDVINRRCY
jgi:hypothetical protein